MDTIANRQKAEAEKNL